LSVCVTSLIPLLPSTQKRCRLLRTVELCGGRIFTMLLIAVLIVLQCGECRGQLGALSRPRPPGVTRKTHPRLDFAGGYAIHYFRDSCSQRDLPEPTATERRADRFERRARAVARRCPPASKARSWFLMKWAGASRPRPTGRSRPRTQAGAALDWVQHALMLWAKRKARASAFVCAPLSSVCWGRHGLRICFDSGARCRKGSTRDTVKLC